MGNLLATPAPSNYRRLAGNNRAKVIRQLNSETTDLLYIFFIYFIIILGAIILIYLYSTKHTGPSRFPGDKYPNEKEGLWDTFVNWLMSSPADRRCPSIPTDYAPVAANTITAATNNLCSVDTDDTTGDKPDSDCITEN